MNRSYLLLFAIVCAVAGAEITEISFDNNMPDPTFREDKMHLQEEDKIVGQGFSQFIN